ncbi:hypothetical protein Vafri_5587, partial [Volvox africanus]
QDQPAAGPSARPRRPSRWDQGPQEVPVPVPTNVVPETVFAPASGTARPAATVNAPADTVTTPAAANGSAMGAARAAAVPASPVPVTPVPVVPAIPDTVASTEAGPSTLPSAASREEVRVSIPTPVLDIEAKEDVRRLPSKVRAFIRNCEHLFSLTSWGSRDGGRCLFLTNALKGKAKEWLDDWAMHRRTYTSAELLLALEARFAPQVTSRDTEARQKLSSRSYRMRPSETVAAYQSRFEAILTDVESPSDPEKIFWFHSGLSDSLIGVCASDLSGNPFKDYQALVRYALSQETRQTAARNVRTSTLRAYSLNAQGLDPEMEDAEVPPLPKRLRTMPAVTVPVAAAAVSDPTPAALGGPSASRRMRVGPPGKRLSVAEYRERQALGACFGCGSTDHQWRLCPENPNAKKGLKASGGVVKHKGSKGPKYRNKGQGKGKGNDA